MTSSQEKHINQVIKIGIIGGTGLDQDTGILKDKKTIHVPTTKYGDPSDLSLTEGTMHGVPVVIMGRHGQKHNINPSDVNYRANLWTLKSLGCTHVIVTTACGSLKESIEPGHYAILDQYIDRTSGRRASTFYKVSHIPQAKPYDKEIQRILEESCRDHNYNVHPNVTVVTIEGPRFSTLAESKLYRSWGCDIVNMTAVPEVTLASELGLVYGALGLVTDYDCWHEKEHESVSVEVVMSRLKELAIRTRNVLDSTVLKITQFEWTAIIETKENAAKSAIMWE